MSTRATSSRCTATRWSCCGAAGCSPCRWPADGMRPIDRIDAYPPGVDANGDWYDEMLVSGDLVVVIGYSYARGGTEINRFHIGRDGHLSFVDAYQLRSNDYYSSRNYASRLDRPHADPLRAALYRFRRLRAWRCLLCVAGCRTATAALSSASARRARSICRPACPTSRSTRSTPSSPATSRRPSCTARRRAFWAPTGAPSMSPTHAVYVWLTP